MLGIAGVGERKNSGEGSSFRNGSPRENISTWERHSKGQRLPEEWRGEQERSFRNFQSTGHWQFNARMVSRVARPHKALGCLKSSCLSFGIQQSREVEKAMAPHSTTLAWKIPWMEEPGGLQSMGSLRVRHD